MANNIYAANSLTGGSDGSLDYIDGAILNDGDSAIVFDSTSSIFYTYTLDAYSGASESSPNIISPNQNAGTKRWILNSNYFATSKIELSNSSIEVFNSDQNWTEYSGNPVLENSYQESSGIDTTSFDWMVAAEPCVIEDNGTYKMWYTAEGNDGYSIGYAESSDGTSWIKYEGNPVLEKGTGGDFDSYSIATPNVIKDDNLYKIWYTGYNSGTANRKIGYAESPDGTSWVKIGISIDVGTSGDFDNKWTFCPNVIKDNNIYKMWYSAYSDETTKTSIGYAESTDGTSWIKFNSNPVLELGSSGSFDDYSIYLNCVIKDGGLYKMWYNASSTLGVSSIGYATSPNGTTWYKHINNPVLESVTGEWNDAIGKASVLIEGGSYNMWYTGSDPSDWVSIGLASAPIESSYMSFIIDGSQKVKIDQDGIHTYSGFFGQDSDSASSPVFTFENSPTTGIYSDASNQLGFSTNGSQRMIINENGNVGIGRDPQSWASLSVSGQASFNILGATYGMIQGVISQIIQTDDIIIDGKYTTQSVISENNDVTGQAIIDSFTIDGEISGVWNYVVSDGTNARAGTITSCWLEGTPPTITYKETFTDDIGDTSAVSFTVTSYNNTTIRLVVTPTSGSWIVKVTRLKF